MFKYRPASERGITREKGVISYHSFTFNRYYNQNYLGCSDLRVLNEVELDAQAVFDIQALNNQEILTILFSGSLEYKDSAGNKVILQAGEAQLIHGVDGVSYTQTNTSDKKKAHFIQIWMTPNQTVNEVYSQVTKLSKGHSRQLLASNVSDALLNLYQDADIYFCTLASGESYISNDKDAYYWVQIISGSVEWGDMLLQAGDGLHFYAEEGELKTLSTKAEFLLFRMNIPK